MNQSLGAAFQLATIRWFSIEVVRVEVADASVDALLQCGQTLEDRRIACSSSSWWCAFAAGNESTSGNSSLSYRCLPYYLSNYVSYPSLDFCRLCRLCRFCHHSLQGAELLEQAHSLSCLQLPIGQAWRWSHRAWRSSWSFCPSWFPGRFSTGHSLGSHEGGWRCALPHSSWRWHLHLHHHQCQWLLALCGDCNPLLYDRSATGNCRHLCSHVAWCPEGLP